jgi:hypothetical protein
MGSLELLSVDRQEIGWQHDEVVRPDIYELSQANQVHRADTYEEALEEARLLNARVLGEVSLRQSVEVVMPDAKKDRGNSIFERLHLAAEGDTQAFEALRTDTTTELSEMICKGGAIMEVTAQMNADGELEQFDQTTYRRQKNTLAFFPDQSPQMRANTMAEGQNGFLVESLWRRGLLHDKQVVEFSLILDNEDRKALDEYGYYLKEMIGIIRLTRIAPDGTVTITSALVGGVDQDVLPKADDGAVVAAETRQQQAALANRFDLALVRDMYRQFGYEDAAGFSSTELLAKPLVVPDDFDILDFVKQYDATASRLTGKETFFGLTTLRNRYDAITDDTYRHHAETSRRQQADLKQTAHAVMQEVLARRHETSDAASASELLRSTAKNHAVRYVVAADNVDTSVFGAHAELFMRHARELYTQGDILAAQHTTARAQTVAKDTGCPTPGRKSAETPSSDTSKGNTQDGRPEADEDEESLEGKPEKMRWGKGICKVSNCPTRPKSTRVGPCSVCWGCQKHFDHGRDPAQVYKHGK